MSNLPQPVPSISFRIRRGINPNGSTPDSCKMNAATDCGPVFSTAQVSKDAFQRVYNMVETELLPVTMKGYLMHLTFYTKMKVFAQKQIQKGFVGMGQESYHEKKVALMQCHLATLQNNMAFVATQVKDKANAVLSKYRIMATCALEREPLVNYSVTKRVRKHAMIYIVGLEFHLIA
jgi:hypothetical protein